MNGINKVIIVGTLGRDPEVRYTANGNAVANITVATSEHWKDKETGEKKEETEWHKIVLFGHSANSVGKHLGKGCKVYVEGRLKTRSWEKDGEKKYTTEIVCDDIQYITFKDRAEREEREAEPQQQQPQQPQQQDNGFDDDIPF